MYGTKSMKELREANKKTKIELFIKENTSKKGYCIQGIMVNLFGVKEEDTKGVSFKKMEKGLPAMYSQIRSDLKSLIDDNKIVKQKCGRAYYYYWNKNRD